MNHHLGLDYIHKYLALNGNLQLKSDYKSVEKRSCIRLKNHNLFLDKSVSVLLEVPFVISFLPHLSHLDI